MKTYLNGEPPSLALLLRATAQESRWAPFSLGRLFAEPPGSSGQPPLNQEPEGLNLDSESNSEKDNPVLNTPPNTQNDEEYISFESAPSYKYKPEEPRFQKKPGVYMILCKVNGKRYYGESSDISVRLAKHRYELKNGIQGNQFLQSDWTLYGKDSFEFQIIQMGEEWGTKESRIEVESTLIKGDRARCYNTYAVISERTGLANSFWGKNHTPESKKKDEWLIKGHTEQTSWF